MVNSSALADAALADLESNFRGELIRPGDAQYDAARAIWNGAIDRRPALIARCTGTADVRAAVRFARERDLLVAVRGGGHNVAGTAVCDGGLVIDLSPMKGLWVDPAGRTVRAQAGLLWVNRLFSSETGLYVGMTVSPDGRWVLVSLPDPDASDIMLVEGFR